MSTDTHLTHFSMALKKIKYDVIGLSEVKREDEEIIQRSDFILYTITKTRKRGSVGIAVNSVWKNNIQSFLSYSDRVCLITLLFSEGSMCIIQAYAPTSQAPDEELIIFYDNLEKAINHSKNSTWLIVMGDFNAKIGQPTDNDDDVMGQYGFGERNERGKSLLEFARKNELFISNSMFYKRPTRRHTWTLGRAKNEIDFILIKRNIKKLIKDVMVLNRFEYPSDHRMVRLCMLLKASTQRKKFVPKIQITNDDEKILEFQSNLESFCNKTAINDSNINLQKKYNIINEGILSAAATFRKKKPHENMISEETRTIIKERESLLINRRKDKISEELFKVTRRKANKAIQADIRKFELF